MNIVRISIAPFESSSIRPSATSLVIAVGLMGLLLQGAQAQGCAEFVIRWIAYAGAPPTVLPGQYAATNDFTLVETVRLPDPPPKFRSKEILEQTLVVVARDAAGLEVSRAHIVDPRIVRVDGLYGTSGSETQTYHRSQVEFSVTLPESSPISTLDLYESVPSVGGLSLSLLGQILVP